MGVLQGSQRLAQIYFEAHGREVCHREKKTMTAMLKTTCTLMTLSMS
jgi:hypothetical protein